jgi:hypothetical protein
VRMASGELECAVRKASDIMSCGKDGATRNLSTAQYIAADFNHSRPHSVTDYCQ